MKLHSHIGTDARSVTPCTLGSRASGAGSGAPGGWAGTW